MYLIKLRHRLAGSKKVRGQITLWLMLSFLVFFSLYGVCMQSVQRGYARQKAERAVQAGIYSLFSEYEPHLFENYNLFGLDIAFGSGRENPEELCGHLWHFVDQNKGALSLTGVNLKNTVRLTDDDGAAFYWQAIRVMKEKTGAFLADDWIFEGTLAKEMQENADRYLQAQTTMEEQHVSYEEEDEDAEKTIQEWKELREKFWLSMVLPSEGNLSGQTIDLSKVPSKRKLSQGIGSANGLEGNPVAKEWFITYLSTYFTNAEEMLSKKKDPAGYLDYQMEYIICGKGSDQENLEQIVKRLLLIREGTNYLFLLMHPSCYEKAEMLASVLSVLLGVPEAQETLEQLFLLGWAYAESVVEVRQLLLGKELSVIKRESDWQVPFSGVLTLPGNPGRYDSHANGQEGLSYKSYLKIFMNLESRETLCMRGLDILEGVIQRSDSRCSNFHVDHCVEKATVEVWMEDLYLERTYGYE